MAGAFAFLHSRRIFAGICFEERNLPRMHGQAHQEYQRRMSMIVSLIKGRPWRVAGA